jgi:hypothetical protein
MVRVALTRPAFVCIKQLGVLGWIERELLGMGAREASIRGMPGPGEPAGGSAPERTALHYIT